MKSYFFIFTLLLCITEIKAQTRRDLIWEYKKLISNDSHLGISLAGDVSDFPNNQIFAVLDSAWIKKKIIILLQILGYLPNPDCVKVNLSDQTIRNALLHFKNDHLIAVDLDVDKKSMELLNEHYLNSQNEDLLPQKIINKGLSYHNVDILLISYKNELELQIWIKARNSRSMYVYLGSYGITAANVSSIGPKSMHGDNLTPEGVYSVYFYPALRWSDFYLAFRISYPNDADIARRNYWGITTKAGGDINLHGCCISIGCIPIGNPNMEELFLLIRSNQKNESSVGIIILPFKFQDLSTRERIITQHHKETNVLEFWKSLESINEHFLKFRTLPALEVDLHTGYYKVDLP